MKQPNQGEIEASVWKPEHLAHLIQAGAINGVLSQPLIDEILALTDDDLAAKVRQTMLHPSTFSHPFWAMVLAAQYYRLFEVLKLPKTLAVYEPGAGAEPPVVVASAALGGHQSRYTTMNLNKPLHTKLMQALNDQPSSYTIIEANALTALDYLTPDSFDVACFNHSINDILQTAVAEANGMDTRDIDWFAEEQQMIEWLEAAFQSGDVERTAKKALLQIIQDAVTVVRRNGYLIFFHCVFEGMQTLSWFPWKRYNDLIPITRNWIAESALPVEEVQLPGIDPQWWMILKVQ